MKNTQKHNGFTLIELALVLLLGGILLGTLSTALLVYIKNSQLKTTRLRIDVIDESIQQYLNLNGRLPCPAPLNAPIDTSAFGREVSHDCTSGAHAGTFRSMGRDGRQVRIGAVPVRTINIPDDFAADAYGYRFTYAVTEVLATPTQYDRELGAISVVDSDNNSTIMPVGSAHYIVLSHGADGSGAHSIDGIPTGPCPAPTTTLDAVNCENSATFRRTLLTGSGGGPGHYDDIMLTRAISAFGTNIPPGAVMAFNLATCPPGWVPFNDAIGRVVIGLGNYQGDYSFSGRPNWVFSETYTLGQTGGFATWRPALDDFNIEDMAPGTLTPAGTVTYMHRPTLLPPVPAENRQPFVALMYCQKT